MPKLPKHKTPLRLFREATGESQRSFAIILEDTCGLSPNTYVAMEKGVRAVPADFATQLMILFGVEPDSLSNHESNTTGPKDITGRKYTSESRANWPGGRYYDADWVAEILQRIIDRLIVMLLAARRKSRLTLGLVQVERSLQDLHEKLHLRDDFNAVAGENFDPWPAVKIYTGGAPVDMSPPRFPLAEKAINRIKQTVAKFEANPEEHRERFQSKEDRFFKLAEISDSRRTRDKRPRR